MLVLAGYTLTGRKSGTPIILKIYRRGMWLLFFNQSFETF
jgi:hypothetical protein